MNWNTIESDPAVFTAMMETLGVQDIEITEIFSFEDAATFERLRSAPRRADAQPDRELHLPL